MSAYLDASAILPILIEEPGSTLVDRFITDADAALVVSEFAAAEVASALSRLVRTGLLEAADATDRLGDFDAWRASATTDIDLQASDIRLATSSSAASTSCSAPPTPCTPPSAAAAT